MVYRIVCVPYDWLQLQRWFWFSLFNCRSKIINQRIFVSTSAGNLGEKNAPLINNSLVFFTEEEKPVDSAVWSERVPVESVQEPAKFPARRNTDTPLNSPTIPVMTGRNRVYETANVSQLDNKVLNAKRPFH